MISAWRFVLSRVSHSCLGDPCCQVVLCWVPAPAGHRPGPRSPLWCELAVWPKACFFTWWNSHLFMCGCPYSQSGLEDWMRQRWQCVQCIVNRYPSGSWTLGPWKEPWAWSGAAGPPGARGASLVEWQADTCSVLPCLLCENGDKPQHSVNLGCAVGVRGFYWADL